MQNGSEAILAEMQPILSPYQFKRLVEALKRSEENIKPLGNIDLLKLFLTAKEVEGCSAKTIAYYESTLERFNASLAKPYSRITSDDLRRYLNDYEAQRGSSKVTIDNIRRIMSSFFSWLEDEDYIVKSPVRKIRRVKVPIRAKETFSDEDLQTIRDCCDCRRDLAIIDLLSSSGMRVGELVNLNIEDVNLQGRECVVLGKGNKQRLVYFDAQTKLHLLSYLESRNDSNKALFVSLDKRSKRLSSGAIEKRLKVLGEKARISRVHPHKFRRTLATNAIDKGMPIEQVQRILGHSKIETTMHYAMVKQSNVKASHERYLS